MLSAYCVEPGLPDHRDVSLYRCSLLLRLGRDAELAEEAAESDQNGCVAAVGGGLPDLVERGVDEAAKRRRRRDHSGPLVLVLEIELRRKMAPHEHLDRLTQPMRDDDRSEGVVDAGR